MAIGRKDRQKNLSGGITRRKFLKTGSSALLASSTFAASPAKASNDDFDVIVIGAGIAGLAAAKFLAGLDYSVVVLEAAPQIGGRIRTSWELGAPFEVGAGWIHGPEKNPVSDLAAKFNAQTFVTDDLNFRVFSAAGAIQPNKVFAAKYKELQRIYKRIDDRFDGDQSLERAISRTSKAGPKDPVLRWMTSAYTEFSTGGPIEDLSAYFFDEDDEFWGKDVILPGGYEQIPKSLAEGLDIRLNTKVDYIEYEEGDGAAVYSEDDVYESDFIICTVPLGVLKKRAITFDPPLPASHQDRIDRIGFGNVTKLALKFDKPFWPLNVQYFGYMGDPKGRWNYFLNYRTFNQENILLGLSVGSYPLIAEKMSDDRMVADCMDALHSMFGTDIPAPSDYQATRWSQDPLSFGAYSYAAVGNKPGDFNDLAKPLANTVLFAGEHTTFDYHGTTHGAYLSGLAAARLIEEELAE